VLIWGGLFCVEVDVILICCVVRMEEQFILRVTPSIAEKLDRLLSDTASSSEEQSLDLSFSGENVLPLHFMIFLVVVTCIVL
jgi:hypothetical protein